jgi:hypothetical protein
MKQLLLTIVLFAQLVSAEDAPRVSGANTTIFSYRAVAGSSIVQQQGVFLYLREDGLIFGEAYHQGQSIGLFGGTADFTEKITRVMKTAAVQSINWKSQIEAAVKKNRRVSVLDGWNFEVYMNYAGSSCRFEMMNAGPYIQSHARDDEQIARLSSVFDAIALEFGRSKLLL